MAVQKKERRKMLIYLAAFIMVAAGGFIYKMFFDGNAEGFVNGGGTDLSEAISTDSVPSAETTVCVSETAASEAASVEVYICGQVQNPGVYSFEPGVILNDVIERAGGLTQTAAVERINLVYVITSNLSVYIPTEEECESGYSDDSGLIRPAGANSWKDAGQGRGSGKPSGPVNINTAPLEELMTLPGIGEVLAGQIISYREEHPFSSCEEICKVSGIGESKYDKIKDLIVCK